MGAEQVLHSTVGVQHRRLQRGALPERSVDVGERRDEIPSAADHYDLCGNSHNHMVTARSSADTAICRRKRKTISTLSPAIPTTTIPTAFKLAAAIEWSVRMSDYWIVGARIIDGTGRDPVDGQAIDVVDGG
ncbi:hypothetical protein [Amycolatopsis coloradensis]|uniref:hypothetical protein n=1 Tax=Amycolatopsis coloradensis TaxID=76021 RepID=UPI0011785F2E|nr:hypothetical protein [Amycolatopsis coloradensis]